MKKLTFTLLICILFNSARALTYYFSSISGDDNRTAAEAQNQSTPWKTLSKLNSFFPSLLPGDVVLLKRGEVFNGSIIVTASGSLSSPITLSAYGSGSKPVISGFTVLSNWVSIGNGIYESYNPSIGASLNMVIINGIQQAMGRYPNIDEGNGGYLTFESHNNNTSITDNQLTSAINWTGAQLVVRTNRFVLDRVLITDHSGGTLTYTPALSYVPGNNFGYFIQNDIRTLDEFGEWYYNPSTKKVSMYFGGASPDSYTIKASAVDTLFSMYNLDNVIVDGLSFEGANKRAMNFYSVDVGVSKVLNSDIKFCGENGLVCGTSKGIIIDGNTITDANNFGIYCTASGAGNFTITNNTIKRISIPPGMAQGGANFNIGIKANADNSIIQGNILDSIGYSGIRFTGDFVEVRKNFIQHYCLNLDDGGGIYVNQTSGTTATGRKIISNIVMNGGAPMEGQTSVTGATNGIYLDDNVTGVIVDSNTVANNNLNGIFLHNCVSVTARINTVYNSTISQFRMVHNTPQSNFRSIAINNNILVSKTTDQSTFYGQTDASDPDFSLWGAIDNNYHARPLLQTTVIKAVKPSYNQNLTIDDWYALSTFDQHSHTSPKTFSSSINPDDSIRFEYNATSVAKTINLTKECIDIKSTRYSGTLTLQPFTSLILLPPPVTPTINITSPANNTSFAAPATIVINASAGASGLVNKVDFYNGSTLLGTDNTSPYSFTWNNVSSGNYSLTAKVTDDVSQVSTSSVVNISVNQPPTVSITTPANNTSLVAPATVTINATAADADGTISKVDFYNGATLLGTDNTSPYTFTWTGVQSGNYFITAKATDNGSLVTTSAAVAVSVNSAPTVSISAPANNTIFAAPADIIINAIANDADGTVSKVDFYNGTTFLGTDDTSPYTFTWTGVAKGNYSLIAKATDNGSLVTSSAAIAVSVNLPPTVSITTPADNATFPAAANITINATANDADGTINKVDFYNGATLLGSDNTSPYSFTWTSVPAGNYSLTAKATDNSSLVTTSAGVAISVYTPNVAPTVNVTSPAINQVFPSPARVTISADAFDNDGTVSKVDFYNGATLLGSDNISPFTFTWDNVAAGNYSIIAVATDNGSLATSSAAVAITVNSAPTVGITSPANNQTFPAPAGIIISATAADADGTISKVDFYNGNTLIGTDFTSPYSVTWNNVAAGNYSITAIADDGTQVTSSQAIIISVYTQNVAPTVSITSPAINQTFSAPANITIDATAADVDGTVSKVDFYNGNTFLGSDNTSPYSFTWSNVPAGSYSINAKADDGSLVTSSDPVAVSVYMPNVAPVVSITSPANDAVFNAPATITITANASDDGTVSKVDFYNGNTFLGSDNTSPYSFTWNNVSPGNYALTAKATDDGSLVTSSQAIIVAVNAQNVAPTVSITSPADNTSFTAPATITINAAAADADGTISKVDFYNGTTLIGTDDTSPYSFTWTNVAAGNYSITAKATDNSSLVTTSAPIGIIVNSSAPTVSIIAPADNTTFTAPASVTINATAADADGTVSKVDFYNGATLLGTDNTSPYSFTWNSMAAGNYSITAKATDNSSLVTTSAPIGIIVNSSAPTVSITAPADNTTFTAPASVTINATAADADGTVSKVDFYNGATLLGTDNTSPYSFTWNSMAAGNYSITAKATDNSSLVTTSAPIGIIVNSSAPTVSITAPADNTTFTAPASVTINATAADADGTVSKVDFYNGATLIGTDNTNPYSFTWTNVAAGNYSITAKATDNSSLVTTSAPIGIIVNSSAPTVSITAPADNTTFTAPAIVTINATAADADGTVGKVDFYNGATLLGTDNTSPYTFTWTNVAAGNYSITAKATDNSSLVTTSAPIGIIVNSSAPTVSITAPADNTTFTAPAIITINATAADADGTVSKVDFYNGATLLGTDNTSPYTFTWTNVAAGNYSITAKATDNSSLVTTSAPIGITVNSAAPTVSVTSPVNNAIFTAPASVTINATAADADGTVSKVDFYNGATLLGTNNTSPYTFTWANVAAGNYSITAKATDNSSLVTTSTAVAIIVNSSAPTVSVTSPANNAIFTAPASVTINATAADADGTVSKVDFYNGATLLGTNNTSPYTFTWANVAAGNYSITAKATDNSSLVTTSTAVAIIVNSSAPTVSVTSPANNAIFTAPASVTINATAADADGTVSKVDFYNGATLLGTDNTSPYTFTWTNVAAGNYSITAKATDNSSLVTTSTAVAIIVNSSAPTVSVTSPANNAIFTAPASVTINATAADADGTVSKVDFYNGATLLGTDNTSPYSFTWANVAAGNYSITAKATDNSSLVTTSTAVAIIVNSSAPTVSVTSPANNAIFTAPASVTINATAADADGTVSKVDFYNGATLLGTDNTSPYTFTWTNVAAGNYSITAKATDNSSLFTTSTAVAIIVNSSAPTVSVTSPANNAIFSAPASVTINATAADADGTVSKVDFYNGATLLGTDNTSPYSFTWTNVAAGNYSITAKATDNSSLVTTSTAVAIIVNSSAPTVSVTSPANNAIFASPATVTINATAADADGTVSKVDFYNGATLLGTDNTSPYSFTWSNVAAGNYTLTAKATDNTSLVTTSGAVAITVNSAPTVSITSPVNNASFASPATITINATAADAGGSVSKVDFYNGSTLLGTDNTSPYSFTWANVPAGNYTLTAKATDNSSLVTTSANVAISVSAAPTVSITTPANNAIFASPATITIGATATDADGSISKVDFYNGSTFLGSDNTTPYTFIWTNVPAGSYSLTAKATDNSSLVTTSAAVALSVNAAPTVSITSPANSASFTAPASVVIRANAADAGGSISKVDFYNGSTLLGTDNTSPYTFTWNNVTSGNYSLTAKATDNSSLVTTSSAIAIVVTGPPTVSITSPANNATFTPPASVVINATAADPGGSVSKVEFFNGSTLLGTDNTSPYSFTWNNVTTGTYSLTARATDNSALKTTSTVVSITVNAAPTVSITSPANNANFSASSTITINATAADPGGSVTKVDFYNGSTLLGTDNTSPYTFSWKNVPVGSYSVTAKATDNMGLTKVSATVLIKVTTALSFFHNIKDTLSALTYK